MVKFMVIFYQPADEARFENTYNDFLALVERMPDIQRRQVVNVLGSPAGKARHHRILEVYYLDYARMQRSLNSPAGQEAGNELGKFPDGAFEMIFADVYEEAGGRPQQSR